MSDAIKPMTVVVVAIFPDGTTRMKVEGRATIADVMLAAKHMELESADAYSRSKMAQIVEERRKQIAVVPEGAIPAELLKREG